MAGDIWGYVRICEDIWGYVRFKRLKKATECHVFYSEECWLEACWSGTKFNYWSHSEDRVFTAGWQVGWGGAVRFECAGPLDRYCLHRLCRVPAPGIVMLQAAGCRLQGLSEIVLSVCLFSLLFCKCGREKRETRRAHIILHFRTRYLVSTGCRWTCH